MKDHDKSKQQLISELGELRQRVTELEKASQDRETDAALVLQVAPLGIHECDTNGQITFVNPSQERITGYTEDQLVGTYIWDWIEPGPQKDSLPAYLKHLVSEQPPPTPFVTRNTRKNGEVYDIRVDWNYKRNPQGQVTGFVSIISDITEQRQTEQQLRHSERTLRTLMDASPESILLLDSKGMILFANTTTARRLGRPLKEMVGRTPYDVFPSEVAAVRTRYFEEVVRTGEPIRFADERFDRHIETALHPVLDEQGKVTAVAVLGIDQTERKRAEEALKNAHDELERYSGPKKLDHDFESNPW